MNPSSFSLNREQKIQVFQELLYRQKQGYLVLSQKDLESDIFIKQIYFNDDYSEKGFKVLMN